MDSRHAPALRDLVDSQLVAALGTLHGGEPAVSMVPFARVASAGALAIHVSRLATHTRDMEEHPTVSLLVTAERSAGVLPQALARATLNGRATHCSAESAAYAEAKAAYLARFPESEPMFEFGDFSIVLIEPHSVRLVLGFAQAWSLTAGEARRALALPP